MPKNSMKDSSNSYALKILLAVFVLGLFLSLPSFAITVSKRLSGEREGVGVVVEANSEEVFILNRRQEKIKLLISDDTKIYFLNKESDAIEEGQSILVKGTRIEKGVIDARSISVVKPGAK